MIRDVWWAIAGSQGRLRDGSPIKLFCSVIKLFVRWGMGAIRGWSTIAVGEVALHFVHPGWRMGGISAVADEAAHCSLRRGSSGWLSGRGEPTQ